MIQHKIESIFPTPLFSSQLHRPLTTKEKTCVHEELLTARQNQGNSVSDNMRVLGIKELQDLKVWFDQNLRIYLDKVYAARSELDLVITQSWINHTAQNQYHHQHKHPNSVVSGVFYVNTTGPDDSIKFEREYRPWLVENCGTTPYNIEQIQVLIKPGQLILFPSDLTHSVPPNPTKFSRISLSFNTMFKGQVHTDAGCALSI